MADHEILAWRGGMGSEKFVKMLNAEGAITSGPDSCSGGYGSDAYPGASFKGRVLELSEGGKFLVSWHR